MDLRINDCCNSLPISTDYERITQYREESWLMSDRDEITETVFGYFEGYKTKDRARLERAFAVDVANMMGYWKNQDSEMELFSKPMKEVIDTWVSPDYALKNFADGKILDIQVFSDVGATVLFDCGGIFTDTFQMAKLDGTWRIVNKFFVDQ